MNKTAQLVNEWARFEEIYPKAGLDDFCRHYLVNLGQEEKKNALLEGLIPQKKASALTKLLVKIVRIYEIYIAAAMKEIRIKQAEEFYFLSIIKNLGTPKKTEVIHHTVNELSNGLNILKSLREQGYIKEQADKEDKRSKRVSLTTKGEEILQQCYSRVHKVSELIFAGIPDNDILLCIQLLKNIEINFSGKWALHKNKPFDEVYTSLMNKRSY
jgi:DNA-binding MarR family transcriptional regulator